MNIQQLASTFNFGEARMADIATAFYEKRYGGEMPQDHSFKDQDLALLDSVINWMTDSQSSDYDAAIAHVLEELELEGIDSFTISGADFDDLVARKDAANRVAGFTVRSNLYFAEFLLEGIPDGLVNNEAQDAVITSQATVVSALSRRLDGSSRFLRRVATQLPSSSQNSLTGSTTQQKRLAGSI